MTKILGAEEPGTIEKAAKLIKAGELVAFPTDTLYGVGADISNAGALVRLYKAKNRPRSKGIPILLASKNYTTTVAAAVPEEAKVLMEYYWPGPLTLILRKQPSIAAELSPNEGIAVRVPGNDVARALIERTGGALAVTSVNQSGLAPALTAEEALTALGDAISAVIDGGAVQYGIASTIIDFTTDPPRLVRAGPIPAGDLIRDEAEKE